MESTHCVMVPFSRLGTMASAGILEGHRDSATDARPPISPALRFPLLLHFSGLAPFPPLPPKGSTVPNSRLSFGRSMYAFTTNGCVYPTGHRFVFFSTRGWSYHAYPSALATYSTLFSRCIREDRSVAVGEDSDSSLFTVRRWPATLPFQTPTRGEGCA